MTREELLTEMRATEKELYSVATETEIKKLPKDKIKDFVNQQSSWTTAIATLETALLQEIREQLEQQSGALREGIGKLNASLAKIESAAGWAAAIGGVLDVVGKVVKLV